MTNHQYTSARFSERSELLTVAQVNSQGLFYKHVFAGLESAIGHLKVRGGWSGDDDGIDVGILQNLSKICTERNSIKLLSQGCVSGFTYVTNRVQNVDIVKSTNQVHTPRTCSHDCYVFSNVHVL